MMGVGMSGWLALANVTAALGAFACLCAPFLLWNRGRRVGLRVNIIVALGTAGVVLVSMIGPAIDDRLEWLIETIRNLAFLALMGALFGAEGRQTRAAPLHPVLFALALAELAQVPLMVLTEWFRQPEALEAISNVASLIRMLFVVGMLVLVHNLFVGAEPDQRIKLGQIATALVLAWGFELNFHAFAYLAGHPPEAMVAVRGLAWGVVAVLFYRDGRSRPERRFAPSRSVTFQSLSLLIIALYLLGIFALDAALRAFALDMGVASQLMAILLTVLIGSLLASSGLRAMIREAITRNLFRHRFDYRGEWLRFSRMMGAEGRGSEPLGIRAIQALGEIVDSPAGLLLSAEEGGNFALASRWQWPDAEVPFDALARDVVCALEEMDDVVSLDDLRGDPSAPLAQKMPEWLFTDVRAWAVVPLMLDGRMMGAVVLAQPTFARKLDWEDHDLLRIVGQQLAVHLSEQAAQRALLDAARFEEFNRRMAFVMHDIKNLASQLGLTVSNAEKHMENPAFRADMLATLRTATGRMEALLARLSRYGGKAEQHLEKVDPCAMASDMFGVFPFAGRVKIECSQTAAVFADREGLEQVLRHVVQNAIDASHAEAPVHIAYRRNATEGAIEISDEGCGMSAEFVRTQLFAPFVSTKPNGFGIGAFEAREMIRAMKGRIDVVSREGEGTRLTIWLPLAEAGPSVDRERKAA